MLFVLFQSSSLLRMFMDSCDDDGCENVAMNWLFAAFVVAVICALLILAFKWLKKYTAINIIQKTWSRRQTVVLILAGLMPVVLTLVLVWYSIRNFFNYVGTGGLFKGIVVSWILYVMFVFTGHVLSPWRREVL